MATRIVHLNAYRRVTVKAPPETDCVKVRTGTRKNAATRHNRSKTAAPVLQIPTKANKAQRCAAATEHYRANSEHAILDVTVHAARNPVTGAMVLTSTDLDGGDFYCNFDGIYRDNAEAALSTLECMVELFKERAQNQRNGRAMAEAQPVKRPAFEVAL